MITYSAKLVQSIAARIDAVLEPRADDRSPVRQLTESLEQRIDVLMERCDRASKRVSSEPPKPCGRGWEGTKPPGCKRKSKGGGTKSKAADTPKTVDQLNDDVKAARERFGRNSPEYKSAWNKWRAASQSRFEVEREAFNKQVAIERAARKAKGEDVWNPGRLSPDQEKAYSEQVAREIELQKMERSKPSEPPKTSRKSKRTGRADSVHTDDRSPVKRVLPWRDWEIGLQYLPHDWRHRKRLPCGYGHIRRTKGEDGMAVDCYYHGGDSDRLYVVRQLTKEGTFDEHKLMIGFPTRLAAEQTYRSLMPAWAYGGIEPVGLDWLRQRTVQRAIGFDSQDWRQVIDRLDTFLTHSDKGQRCGKGWIKAGLKCASKRSTGLRRQGKSVIDRIVKGAIQEMGEDIGAYDWDNPNPKKQAREVKRLRDDMTEGIGDSKLPGDQKRRAIAQIERMSDQELLSQVKRAKKAYKSESKLGQAKEYWRERKNKAFLAPAIMKSLGAEPDEDTLKLVAAEISKSEKMLARLAAKKPRQFDSQDWREVGDRIDAFLERCDRKGQGKPCGKGFISASKKCSADKAKQLAADLKAGDPGAKSRVARGKELAAERLRLRREVEQARKQVKVKLPPELDMPDISLSDLDKSESMLKESLTNVLGATRAEREWKRIQKEADAAIPKPIKPDAKGLQIADDIARQAKSAIVPFDFTKRKEVGGLLSQIRGSHVERTRLSQEANEQIEKLKFMEGIQEAIAGADEILKGVRSKRRESLERLYKGRTSPENKKLAMLNKRIFQVLNPDKKIVIPKDTTEAEFSVIIGRLAKGEKDAIDKYTVPKKPAKTPKSTPKPTKTKTKTKTKSNKRRKTS